MPAAAAASLFFNWAKQHKADVERAIAHEGKRSEVSAAHDKAISFWQDIVARAIKSVKKGADSQLLDKSPKRMPSIFSPGNAVGSTL